MGYYKDSPVHVWFSDFHLNIRDFSRDAYMVDIDRTWVEVRLGEIVMVWDLKLEREDFERLLSEGSPKVPQIAWDWYEKHGVKVYLIVPLDKTLEIKNYRHGKIIPIPTGFKVARWDIHTKRFDNARFLSAEKYYSWVNGMGYPVRQKLL